MAKKISELNPLTGGNSATADLFVLVDVSTGETKHMTRAELIEALGPNFTKLTVDTDTLVVDEVNGRVGVNTDAPSSDYSIGANALATFSFDWLSDKAAKTSISTDFGSGEMRHFATANYFQTFYTNNTERMRIDAAGSLLVNRTAAAINGQKMFIESDNFVVGINGINTTGEAVRFFSNGTTVGTISYTGSATAYNTSSDYRLKEDWLPMAGASARIMDLKPINFAWKVDGSRTDGFLAHELAEVVPEAATGTKDAMRDEEYEITPAEVDEDGATVTEAVIGTRSVPDMQGIDQSKLVPLLTASLQEALTKIESMEARLEALEA